MLQRSITVRNRLCLGPHLHPAIGVWPATAGLLRGRPRLDVGWGGPRCGVRCAGCGKWSLPTARLSVTATGLVRLRPADGGSRGGHAWSLLASLSNGKDPISLAY